MKKSFDEICKDILGENNSDTNPVSTVPNTQATSVIAGGSTAKTQPTQGSAQTPQPTPTPQPSTQQKTPLKPDDVLNTLTKLKDHPEFVKVIGSALSELNKSQQQKDFINKQANAANQST